MNRYLLIATLATAVALFAWQTLSNTALQWHQATLSEFADPDLAVGAMNVVAPESGMYFHEQGIVAAVSMVPGVTDKSAFMGVMMLRQVVLDLIAAFVLALVALRVPHGPVRTALVFGGVALAAGVVLELSDWNWYGFPLAYTLVNTIDVALNGAIAGFVLGWFARRHAAAPVPPAEARSATAAAA